MGCCKFVEKDGFSYFFRCLGLTKLFKLNKILRYRKKNNTVKDREKEEYTSELHREKDSSAEKSFVSKDVEGSFGVVSLKEMEIFG